jgi:polyhydroxyalkanoate synthesis regulator phasin
MSQKFTKLVERMEDLLVASPGLPLTPFVLVNADKLLPIMDRVRECLPEEIRAAQQVLGQRDHLLEEARHQAVQLMEEAQGRFNTLLSESELLRAIEGEANKVRQQMVSELEDIQNKTYAECEARLQEATQQAQKTRNEAEAYATQVMQALEQQVQALQKQIHEGQARLSVARQQSGLASLAATPADASLTAAPSATGSRPEVSFDLTSVYGQPSVPAASSQRTNRSGARRPASAPQRKSAARRPEDAYFS